jgi:hypothetical protein
MLEFENGAKRGDLKPMYQLIPLAGLKRLALTLTEGHLRYDPSLYVRNWQLGDEAFAAGCLDHAIEHLYHWRIGATDEDHLGHALANLMFLAWYEDNGVFTPANPPVEKDVVEDVQEELPPVDPEEDFKHRLLSKLQGLLKK